MPVELATSPLEVVINDVNDDPSTGDDTAAAQWGKKEAAAGAEGASSRAYELERENAELKQTLIDQARKDPEQKTLVIQVSSELW